MAAPVHDQVKAVLDAALKISTHSPAPRTAIEAVARELNYVFPAAYVELMLMTNGLAGSLSPLGRSHLILYAVEQIPRIMASGAFEELRPRRLPFGSDGGGNGFCFDRDEPGNSRILVVDAHDVHRERVYAHDFIGFLHAQLAATAAW